MGQKRVHQDQEGDPSPAKKQVTSWASRTLTADDLQKLLCFTQDVGPNARNNLEECRLFLKKILNSENGPTSEHSLQNFLAYLKPLSPDTVDESRIAMPEIFKTWTFSSKFDDIRLFTICTGLLADILEILSLNVEISQYGHSVCQTILINDHFSLIGKGLATSKARGHLIKECLRLCTQLISFDGGYYSQMMYRKAQQVYSRLEDLLILKAPKGDSKPTHRFLPIRRHTIFLIMAFLRVHDSSTKNEILSDGKTVRAIFQFIEFDDACDQIRSLQTLKRFFYSDRNIQRSSKSRSLPEYVLQKILALTDQLAPDDEQRTGSVADVANEFLLFICGTLGCGALVPQNGWYLSESEDQHGARSVEVKTVPFERQGNWQRYTTSVPVRNTKLAQFTQDLKPFRSLVHQRLALHIFRAAPELVADYFLRKRSFSLQPKLTSTWVGYISFVIAVVQLDLPRLRESGSLPNPFLVLENVLPSCLSREVFTKCLTSGHVLVKLFISKLMSACLTKLQKVLSQVSYCNQQQISNWNSVIIQEFQRRCPEMQAWSIALKSCPDGKSQLKEILIQNIAQCYEIWPSLLLNTRLEVPTLIADSSVATYSGLDSQLEILNTEHLSRIALVAPVDFDWFRRPERLYLSPFMTVMRMYTITKNTRSGRLTEYLINESVALRLEIGSSVFASLIASLQPFSESHAPFLFLDNCFARLVQKPTKYEGDLRAAGFSDQDTGLGLILVVIHEQLPHLLKKNNSIEIQVVKTWIITWTEKLIAMKTGNPVVQYFWENISAQIFRDGKHTAPASLVALDFNDGNFANEQEELDGSQRDDEAQKRLGHLNEFWVMTESQARLKEWGNNFPHLNTWSRKDVNDAIEEGDITALLSYLCADDTSIRRQALLQIQNLSARVIASSYSEKQQLYLLLMELIESVSQQSPRGALSSFAVAFAQAAVAVLHDPAHKLYAKVNVFLLRAPAWNTYRMISYWKDNILAKPSHEAENHIIEMEWLIQLLVDGLRTEADVQIYVRHGIFEAILLRYDQLSSAARQVVIRFLLRCSYIKGGSTLLITRCGFVAWSRSREKDEYVRVLRERILATQDKERTLKWGFGTMDMKDQRLAIAAHKIT